MLRYILYLWYVAGLCFKLQWFGNTFGFSFLRLERKQHVFL